MLAATAMQIAAIEGAFPIRAAIVWTRTYHGMLATPLRVIDLIAGHLLYVATRVFGAACIYLLVITAFGAVHSWAAVFAPLIAIAVGLAFAAPVSAISAWSAMRRRWRSFRPAKTGISASTFATSLGVPVE